MSEKLGAEQGRCNRCQANLCDHDNCTDWTCARACSKCAKGPCHENSSAELTALRAAAASQGVNLTKANIAGYVKGFKAAQEYEKLGAEQGGLELERRCNYYFGGYDGGTRCQKLKGHDGAHLWESDTEQLLSSAISQLTEQAYHARGAGRWVAIADGEGAEARPLFGDKPHQEFHDFMCVCGQPWKECTTDGMREDIAKIDDPDEWTLDEAGKQFSAHWEHECGKVSLYRLSLHEPGADTGTTGAEGLSGMLAERMIKLAIKIQGPYAIFGPPESLERRKKSHEERIEELTGMLTTEFAECLERGTTPPEGLYCSLHSDPSFRADVSKCPFCRDLRAATQRAPVEQGRETPKPPSINANQTAAEQFHEDILSIYGARSQTALRVTCREIFERREREVLKAAAPDHAREGALRMRVEALLADYRDILASLKTTMEQHRERVSAFTTLEAYRHHIDCTEIVVIKLERALADGKEGGE